MSLSLKLALAVLANYRLACLIVYDDGPFDAFKRLRKWAGLHSRPKVRHNLGGLLNCVYCAGMWTALLCLTLVLWDHLIAELLLIWLGLSGGQAFLESITGDST